MKQFVLVLPFILVACGGGGGGGQYDVPTTVTVQEAAPTRIQTAVSPPVITTAQTIVEAETVNPSVPTVVADTSSVPAVTAQDAVVPTTAPLIPPERMKHIQLFTEKSSGK